MSSRSLNSSRNAITGLLKMGMKILFPFFIRSVMLYYLGKEYLGLNSLFSSILGVLNVAELGFSSAVIYRMYKPISEGNITKVAAYLNYLKHIYFVIGVLILSLGIIIIPVLRFIAKGGYPEDINIYILYSVYLLNAGISYFFYGYKRVIIIASQRMDYVNNVETIMFCIQYLIQIITLVLFKNYYCYIIVLPVTTIFINLVISIICKKQFNEYFVNASLSNAEKKEMHSDVKGVAIYKISETTRNSFDSIVISAAIGLISVGIYNNYYYIFSALYSIMVILNQSLQPSIGNSISSESVEKNRNNLFEFTLFSMWLISIFSCCLLGLYQPFMIIWVGKDMLLSNTDMILFCIYFYVLNMNNIRNLYYDGNGLWLKGSSSFIIESLGNLLLNFVLGFFFGITGVLIATIITMFFCSFIWRSYILFKEYFSITFLKKYFLFHFKLLLLCALSSIICYTICNIISIGTFLELIVRGLLCISIPSLMFIIGFYKNPFFSSGINHIKTVYSLIIKK